MVEVQTHEGVARIEAGEEDSCVGLCTGVRLHIGILSAEQLADAVDGQLLDLVDDLTAAIVAMARIALGILVGKR